MGAFTHGQIFAFSLSFYWVDERNVAIGKSGKSGSEYILPFLNGTTASPHGMKNILPHDENAFLRLGSPLADIIC